jgi:hypothetical protein
MERRKYEEWRPFGRIRNRKHVWVASLLLDRSIVPAFAAGMIAWMLEAAVLLVLRVVNGEAMPAATRLLTETDAHAES